MLRLVVMDYLLAARALQMRHRKGLSSETGGADQQCSFLAPCPALTSQVRHLLLQAIKQRHPSLARSCWDLQGINNASGPCSWAEHKETTTGPGAWGGVVNLRKQMQQLGSSFPVTWGLLKGASNRFAGGKDNSLATMFLQLDGTCTSVLPEGRRTS